MKSVLFILISFTCIPVMAQISAITNTGDEVILYEDGTWQYVNEVEMPEPAINPKKFKKSDRNTFQVKSKRTDVGVWIDPQKWKFTKSQENEDSEYEFELKGEDLYGIMITEKVEIPLNTLKGIALENARAVAPDARLTKEEYRNVNGLQLLCLQMEGTIQGIKFAYYGYYYSNADGTVQLITYTAQNLSRKYENEIEDLLNGFVVID